MEPVDIETLQRSLEQRGVATWNAGTGTWHQIPVALTPTIVTKQEWNLLEFDAGLILQVFPKLLHWLSSFKNLSLKREIFAGISDFEQKALDFDASLQWGHATIRLDLFWHNHDIKIIEVNCTIPAMQAYGDNVFNAWRDSGGQVHGESKNVGELLESLIALYSLDGGTKSQPVIGIVHRDGDSQLGELKWMQKEWTAKGFETHLGTPKDVSLSDNSWRINEFPCDLIYRHIFAWRVSNHDIGRALLDNREHHIYNPISSHYETKSFLALLSQVANDDSLSKDVKLSLEERKAIKRRVPQTMILKSDLSLELNQFNFDAIENEIQSYVIKRSIGYGGHHVIFGDQWHSKLNQEKLREWTSSRGPVSFSDFAAWAVLRDNSLWTVQERLNGARRQTSVLTAQGIENWNAYFDASIFMNTRAPKICRGGVSRISKSPIVNIGTGGGLAPFMIIE